MKTKTIAALVSLSALTAALPARAAGVDDGTCRHQHEGFFGHILDVFEEIPGVIELTGIKFPVEHYSYKVSDTLTRGSRLHKEDYAKLAAQGFKAVVDLTKEGTDDTSLVNKNGMLAVQVPTLDNFHPTNDQMKELLDILTSPAYTPAYIHCEAGKGRTGIATAVYRMAVMGWSAEDAIAEAKKFGMNAPNQETFLTNFGCDLKSGKIEGYPLKPMGSAGPTDADLAAPQLSGDPDKAAR